LCPWTGFSLVRRAFAALLWACLGLAALWSPGLACAAAPFPPFADPWSPLIERLEREGFERPFLLNLFARPGLVFDPEVMARKMNALLERRLADRRDQGAESKAVYSQFLKPQALREARAFLRENGRELARIQKRYLVPPEILVALLLVETRLGTFVGAQGAFFVLANMARSRDLALIRERIGRTDLDAETRAWLAKRTEEKAEWAFAELAALLRYAQTNGLDPAGIPGSMYGAIGICQFVPSNVLAYGVDADRDGRVDLFCGPDALHSMANYLRRNGWKRSMSERQKLAVIYRYNHSPTYSRTVLAVASRLSKGKAVKRAR
jgi:membrane-bound lytic murein transglycosylase B